MTKIWKGKNGRGCLHLGDGVFVHPGEEIPAEFPRGRLKELEGKGLAGEVTPPKPAKKMPAKKEVKE